MTAAGITSAEGLTRHLRCDGRTARKLLSGRKPVYATTLKQTARAFGIGDDYSCLVDWSRTQSIAVPQGSSNSLVTPSTLVDGVALQGVRLQDVKVILTCPSISLALLQGGDVPSFLECIRSSATVVTVDDAHKDHPLYPTIGYNHFISAAVVVTLPQVDGACVLGYHRAPISHMPHHIHTRGLSIFFSCSPHRNLVRHARTEFDEWLHVCATESCRADEVLIGRHAPLLLRALRSKIDLCPYQTTIMPLGVVTRDVRSDKHRRVYTQYVYQVEVKIKHRNLDQFVHGVKTGGLTLSRLHSATDERVLFTDQQRRENAQDLVVWRSLRSSAAMVRDGATQFRRGFILSQLSHAGT